MWSAKQKYHKYGAWLCMLCAVRCACAGTALFRVQCSEFTPASLQALRPAELRPSGPRNSEHPERRTQTSEPRNPKSVSIRQRSCRGQKASEPVACPAPCVACRPHGQVRGKLIGASRSRGGVHCPARSYLNVRVFEGGREMADGMAGHAAHSQGSHSDGRQALGRNLRKHKETQT